MSDYGDFCKEMKAHREKMRKHNRDFVGIARQKLTKLGYEIIDETMIGDKHTKWWINGFLYWPETGEFLDRDGNRGWKLRELIEKLNELNLPSVDEYPAP